MVVEWSRSRQRYERQGVLVESAALTQAEEECLSDSASRARRRERAATRHQMEDSAHVAAFARGVGEMFPRCSPTEALQIAEHACLRSNGRTGRTAAARTLDPEAVRLAVAAHVRHVHTPYDRLLSRGGDRRLARERVWEAVEEILGAWREP